jgi:sulfide dehydrogenase cytochrome subunit
MAVLAGGVLLLSVSASSAEPSTQVLANTCAVCHGTDGKSPGSIDKLYQMKTDEFVEEMMEFKYEPGKGRIMAPLARGLTDQQIRDLARSFATLSR